MSKRPRPSNLSQSTTDEDADSPTPALKKRASAARRIVSSPTPHSSSSKPSDPFYYVDSNGAVHRSFCFDGGVIVLKTSENPPGTFQASKTALSGQSPFFRDMFSLAQPDGAETFNGHPLVVVQDDPSDLQIFLRAMHDHRKYFANHERWKSQAAVAAILRLSTKYQVAHLRKSMIDHLANTYYPVSLIKFDEIQRRKPDTPPRNVFQDLSLAKEVMALRLLPSLYYLCAVDTTALELYDAPCGSADLKEKGPCFFRDESDKRICLGLREELFRKTSAVIHSAGLYGGNHFGGDCREDDGCTNGKLAWITDVLEGGAKLLSNPLNRRTSSRLDGYLCGYCTGESVPPMRATRQKVWDDLPSLCGLESWESVLENEE